MAGESKTQRSSSSEKGKTELEAVVASLLTLEEAAEWAAARAEEFGLARTPKAATLVKAVKEGKLEAVAKGRLYLTAPRQLHEIRPSQPG